MNEKRVTLNRKHLETIPLPTVDPLGDKDDRGTALVVGGSHSVPGAVLLAGTGALRAGAGKLQMATVQSAATALAIAVPEALVQSLPATSDGEIAAPRSYRKLQSYVAKTNALLLGPGMRDEKACSQLLRHLIPHLDARATLILDSASIGALRYEEDAVGSLQGRVVITPHAGEMASLMDVDKEECTRNAAIIARQCAARFQVTVVLKGQETFIAEPGLPLVHYREGCIGLATSGSGDTLAGVVAGLCARGAPPAIAAAWGVWAHGSAGNILSRRLGTLGFLANELLAEIPALLDT